MVSQDAGDHTTDSGGEKTRWRKFSVAKILGGEKTWWRNGWWRNCGSEMGCTGCCPIDRSALGNNEPDLEILRAFRRKRTALKIKSFPSQSFCWTIVVVSSIASLRNNTRKSEPTTRILSAAFVTEGPSPESRKRNPKYAFYTGARMARGRLTQSATILDLASLNE